MYVCAGKYHTQTDTHKLSHTYMHTYKHTEYLRNIYIIHYISISIKNVASGDGKCMFILTGFLIYYFILVTRGFNIICLINKMSNSILSY